MFQMNRNRFTLPEMTWIGQGVVLLIVLLTASPVLTVRSFLTYDVRIERRCS
jgi:hypothetical protein